MTKIKYTILNEDAVVEDSKFTITNIWKVLLWCLLIGVIHLYTVTRYEISKLYIESADRPISTDNASIMPILSNGLIVPPMQSSTLPPASPLPNSKSVSQRSYYVYTSQCHMPYVDPFAAKLPKMSQKYEKCAKDDALVSVVYDVNTRLYLLHLNEKIIQKLAQAKRTTAEDVSCCYRQVVRAGSGKDADNKMKLMPCSIFHQDFVVPSHIDYMIVECSLKSNQKSLQKDAFTFVHYKQINTTQYSATDKRKPSVLMIGIDTLSRINIRRTMPNTVKFLESNRWFELQGYNKIGDNTFPNLLGLLSNYNSSMAYANCLPKSVGGLNKPRCNLIWDRFKDFGYHTAYAEDLTTISTFNYLKKGFQTPPTDYYLRPLNIAMEKNLKGVKKDGLIYCLGRRHYGEYIYDYALQFANTYVDEPIFGFFWTNSFSHNRYTTSATMDLKMLDYLETFQRDGILERAIVVFFSDHGARWGKLLSLPEGFLEERLPMFFMSLPKWFKNEHPDFVAALQVNQHRLTTPYDIYMTLKHILELGEPSKAFPHVDGTMSGISIFKEIPENRTCSDAGITDHWCTCTPFETVSADKDKDVPIITNLIVDKINKYLWARNSSFSIVCQTLAVRQVNEALLRFGRTANSSVYRIRFIAQPGNADFQATVTYNPQAKEIQTNVEDISRLNLYAETSKCIQDKEAKKFCICGTNKLNTTAITNETIQNSTEYSMNRTITDETVQNSTEHFMNTTITDETVQNSTEHSMNRTITDETVQNSTKHYMKRTIKS